MTPNMIDCYRVGAINPIHPKPCFFRVYGFGFDLGLGQVQSVSSYVVIGVEYLKRVMHSYYHYIHFAPPPPGVECSRGISGDLW